MSRSWLVWLASINILLALGAIYLSSWVLEAQTKAGQAISTAKDQYLQLKQEVPQLKRDLSLAESELAREHLGWDNLWDGVNVTVQDPRRGIIVAQVGLQGGFGRQEQDNNEELPIVYAFQMTGEKPEYVGAFKVTQVDVNQSAMQLVGRVRPSQTQNWQNGRWRLRQQVPTSLRDHISELDLIYTSEEENLAATQQQTTAQQNMVNKTTEVLNLREQELEGNQAANADAGEVVVNGLIATLKSSTQQRNGLLAEVEALRNTLHEMTVESQKLIQENKDLVNQKSSSAGAAPAKEANLAPVTAR